MKLVTCLENSTFIIICSFCCYCIVPFSLSQQGIWVSFGHPNPQKSHFRTPKIFYEEFIKMSISSIYKIHLNVIHMALFMDIMHYIIK